MAWSEAQKRYAKSLKGKQARLKYMNSAKAKETRRRYMERRRQRLEKEAVEKVDRIIKMEKRINEYAGNNWFEPSLERQRT